MYPWPNMSFSGILVSCWREISSFPFLFYRCVSQEVRTCCWDDKDTFRGCLIVDADGIRRRTGSHRHTYSTLGPLNYWENFWLETLGNCNRRPCNLCTLTHQVWTEGQSEVVPSAMFALSGGKWNLSTLTWPLCQLCSHIIEF